MFFERGQERLITFRYCTDELEDLLYKLWEKAGEMPGSSQWCGLAYLVRDGQLTIDLSYPEQWDAEESIVERRPRMLEHYFGRTGPVDYSMPGD